MITDVSRLRPHRCTIITSIASNTDCGGGRRAAASTLDNGHQSKNRPPTSATGQKPLPERLKAASVIFHVRAQLAESGDPIKDHTQAWPDTRKVVDLGVLTVDRIVLDSIAAEKKLLFLPGNVTDGIEPSDDPLIAARDASYAVSAGRRGFSPWGRLSWVSARAEVTGRL